jgi:CheY-like chemotaxis protein
MTTRDVQLDDQEIFRELHVLVVDDMSPLRTILKKMLLHLGVGGSVAEAQDGLEAWNMLQENTFRLVISDLNMPRMDGFELLRLMRGSQKYQATPLLLITGECSEEQIAAAVITPYENYLMKPFKLEVLAHHLRGLLKSAGLT